MTLRTAPSPHPPADRTRLLEPTPPLEGSPADIALDEALEHIGGLAERLWAVRRLHAPARRRSLFGAGRVRCAGCGHALPCPTLRAVAPDRR